MSNIETNITEGMTFAEMREAKEALEQAMEAERQNAQSEALAQIVEVARSHDLTVDDVVNAMAPKKAKTPKAKKAKASKAAGTKVAPKYQDPNSDATWTGRGRKPKWYADAEAAGADMDSFLIATPEGGEDTPNRDVVDADAAPEEATVAEAEQTETVSV